MSDYSGYLGYLKLQGPGIKEGVLGARQSADALLSFDGALRHFLFQVDPDLANASFDLPVKVREGSWEALIPDTVGEWIRQGGGLAATAYITTAATRLANNDFKDKDTANAVREGLRRLKGVVRIAKHVGGMAKAGVGKGVRFKEGNEVIELPNDNNVYITTTRAELEAYLRTPKKLLEEIARFLGKGGSFAFAEIDEKGVVHEERVVYAQRHIFVEEDEEEPDEVLFPELAHGDYVTLEGSMTRGNKLTNTIGFLYKGHVLTCSPAGVPITSFRDSFFKDCVIGGHVTRLSDGGLTNGRRPKIIFDKLAPRARSDGPQTTLV